jgi:hypothetical protein
VLLQPIGLDDNREAFYQMFDGWADELRETSHRTVAAEDWSRFRGNMYDGTSSSTSTATSSAGARRHCSSWPETISIIPYRCRERSPSWHRMPS